MGYLIQKGGLEASQIGKIIVNDHSAIVAVPRERAAALVATLTPEKLKGKKVRISELRP